jgi:hypothetical protein
MQPFVSSPFDGRELGALWIIFWLSLAGKKQVTVVLTYRNYIARTYFFVGKILGIESHSGPNAIVVPPVYRYDQPFM